MSYVVIVGVWQGVVNEVKLFRASDSDLVTKCADSMIKEYGSKGDVLVFELDLEV